MDPRSVWGPRAARGVRRSTVGLLDWSGHPEPPTPPEAALGPGGSLSRARQTRKSPRFAVREPRLSRRPAAAPVPRQLAASCGFGRTFPLDKGSEPPCAIGSPRHPAKRDPSSSARRGQRGGAADRGRAARPQRGSEADVGPCSAFSSERPPARPAPIARKSRKTPALSRVRAGPEPGPTQLLAPPAIEWAAVGAYGSCVEASRTRRSRASPLPSRGQCTTR